MMSDLSLWLPALCACIVSCLACLALRHCCHGRPWTLDHNASDRRKVHVAPVPRLGGLGFVISLMVASMLLEAHERTWALGLLAVALLVCCAGFAEDVWRCLSPRVRLLCAALAAVMAYTVFPEFRVRDLALPGTAWLFELPGISLFFTVLVVSGFTHSMNLIDGLNGLASLTALAIVSAISIVAGMCGDALLVKMGLVLGGAVLGFVPWNFPRARLFLGDGGAYLLGFLLAELAVGVVQRNPGISPWFACVALLYPTWETLFSLWRRRVVRRQAAMQADGLHLHHLIYKRVFRRNGVNHDFHHALTSLTVSGVAALLATAAVLWCSTTPVLYVVAGGFVVWYGAVYRSLVRWSTPRAKRTNVLGAWSLTPHVRRPPLGPLDCETAASFSAREGMLHRRPAALSARLGRGESAAPSLGLRGDRATDGDGDHRPGHGRADTLQPPCSGDSLRF